MITDLELGGVPLHLRRLAGAMRSRGFQTTVVSLASLGPVGTLLRTDGVEVHACGGRGGWDLRILGRLRKFLCAVRPDVIHSVLFHANVAARYAARREGFPRERVVCEIQTVEVERRWHLVVDRFTHRGCRFTIGNSPSVVEHLASRARIPRGRLRLVRGGIDPARVRDAQPVDRAALGISPGIPLVFWAGRLDPVKGLDWLMDSFHDVRSDAPAHLVLAGDGPLRAQLTARAQRLGLGERVHFLGSRQDVPELLKAADVFVFPSRTEGLPNALLEAMSAPLPIVAGDVPGCRDLIRHEENGLLVSFGDRPGLTAAIGRLLEDRDLARRLADGALQSVTNDWHIQNSYRAYAAIYEEIAVQNSI